MPVQRHDLRRPEEAGGGFEERYWRPLNSPVRAPDGSVEWIIHQAEDVTNSVRLKAESGELRSVAEALRESERHERERAAELAALLDAVPTPVFIAHDPDCFKITGNPAADELLQLERGSEASLTAPEVARPRHFRVFKDGRELSGEELPAQLAARGIPVQDFEETIVFDDGTRREITAYATPVRDEAGKPRGSILVLVDITERKQIQQALAESKQRLAGIVGSAMDAIITVDSAGRIILFNAAAETLFRCDAGEAIGSTIDRFIPERFHAAHRQHMRKFGENGATNRAMGRLGEISGRRADGEEFPIEASISQVTVSGERLFTVILRDVTERHRLEREVLEITASEQRRIGQELHDDVCQWLSGAEMLSTVLAKDLATASPENAARALKVADALRQALTRARMLAHGLVPAVIQAEGLGGALRELASNASEMFGIRCVYEGPELVPLSDSGVALHLYRIAQEAISNAVRHGGAKAVGIHLQAQGDFFSMQIRGDGRAIPLPLPESSGMGLRTMRYRAGMIGAALEIRPGTGGGTEIACSFPLKL